MRESRPCSCESRSPEPPALRPAPLDSRFRGSTGVPRRTLLAPGATPPLPGCAATLAPPPPPPPAAPPPVKVSRADREGAVSGEMVVGLVDLGGRSILKKKKK